MNNKDDPVDSVDPMPKKRGPKPSGVSRNETFKAATKNRRDRLLDAGKVEVKWFIEPSTKQALERAREGLGMGAKAAMGEVLDALMQQLENKNK